jgi:hypothetical protein
MAQKTDQIVIRSSARAIKHCIAQKKGLRRLMAVRFSPAILAWREFVYANATKTKS